MFLRKTARAVASQETQMESFFEKAKVGYVGWQCDNALIFSRQPGYPAKAGSVAFRPHLTMGLAFS
jgi:hypothetical protein